jgi:trk system potassium uptake protein TrkA
MKQFAVIGLGSFGSYLATRLYEKGHDVLAMDRDTQKVQDIKDRVTQAVVADGKDREVLEALGLKEMDAAAVCIGTEMSESILVTLTLKDMGMERIIAMAVREAHGRILEKIGASEVLYPERDMAFSLAERLHNPNMIDYLPFVEGYSIIQMTVPSEFVGKPLRDLDLINQYGVQVVAIKETVPDRLNLIPTAGYVLKGSDLLILLGPNDSLDELKEKDTSSKNLQPS